MLAREIKIANDSLRKYGVKLGADGVAVPLVGAVPGARLSKDEEGGDLSSRIMNACRAAGDDFSDDEIAAIAELLAKAGLEPEMATDSRPRMALDAHTEMARQHAHRQIDARIARGGLEDLYKYPLSRPPETERQKQAFDERYPHGARLLG